MLQIWNLQEQNMKAFVELIHADMRTEIDSLHNTRSAIYSLGVVDSSWPNAIDNSSARA